MPALELRGALAVLARSGASIVVAPDDPSEAPRSVPTITKQEAEHADWDAVVVLPSSEQSTTLAETTEMSRLPSVVYHAKRPDRALLTSSRQRAAALLASALSSV